MNVVVDISPIEEQEIPSAIQRSRTLSRLVDSANTAITFGLPTLLFILTICFGGVHPGSYLPARMLAFVLAPAACLALVMNRDSSGSKSSIGPNSRIALLGCAAFFIYCTVHTAVLAYLQVPHPVLGTTSRLLAPAASISALLEIAFFGAVALITLAYLLKSDPSPRKLVLTLRMLILAVSIVALSHWFYDNGMLFWVFPPETVGTSQRARWPFVNPNHLADFLLPGVFLCLGCVWEKLLSVKNLASASSKRGTLNIGDLFSSDALQVQLRSLIWWSVTLFAATLAMLGSLSRAALVTLALGLFATWILRRWAIRRYESSFVPILGEVSRKKRRRSSTKNATTFDFTKVMPVLAMFVRATVVVGIAGAFWFFLQGRGTELLEARLDYALLYTQDDLRWQLYEDSLPILRASPLFGIGLGNWLQLYPSYMNVGVSGYTPVYLHSDTFQVMIETGLFGFLLAAGSVLLITVRALRDSWQNILRPEASLQMALAAGILSFFVAASFEFPLRLPSVVAVLAVYCALLTTLLDRNATQNAVSVPSRD